MTVYKYKAITTEGKETSGFIEANSEKDLRQQIGKQSQWLIEAEVTSGAINGQFYSKSSKQIGIKLSLGDVVLLTQQLSVLLQSGVALAEALGICAQQSENRDAEWLLRDIESSVSEGISLEQSLHSHSKTFSSLYVALVASGEKTGRLGAVLEQLASYTERKQIVTMSFVKALLYPAILMFTAVGIIVTLMTTVFPRIIAQFAYMQSSLPKPTQLLINISDFLHQYGIWLVLIIVAFWIAFTIALKNKIFRKSFHKQLLQLPFIGKMLRQLIATQFADTLSICSKSGVPLLEGIHIAARVTQNLYVQEQFDEVAFLVQSGESLFGSLKTTTIIDAMMLYMIGSGEKSGKLSKMLCKAAQYQQTMLDNRIDLMVKLFTPILMLLMAGLVFFIIIATLLPILALNNLI